MANSRQKPCPQLMLEEGTYWPSVCEQQSLPRLQPSFRTTLEYITAALWQMHGFYCWRQSRWTVAGQNEFACGQIGV